MLDIERALKDQQVLKSLTGLGVKQFSRLSRKFDLALEEQLLANPKKRLRAPGGGRKHTLETGSAKLFFILFYLRVYPTMAVAGFLFGVARSVIHDWVHFYHPILELVLGDTKDLPERKVSSVKDFTKRFPGTKRLIIDATERPVNRPKDAQKQREYYSGKKKRHTLKNTLGVDPDKKRILLLSLTIAGSVHDKTDLDNNEWVENIPEKIPIDVDLGYKGLENEFVKIRIPHKKPRNGELTPKQKEQNKIQASKRVVVEHKIGHIKRYQILKQQYRNRKDKFEDSILLTCAGLSNFYQRTRIAA